MPVAPVTRASLRPERGGPAIRGGDLRDHNFAAWAVVRIHEKHGAVFTIQLGAVGPRLPIQAGRAELARVTIGDADGEPAIVAD